MKHDIIIATFAVLVGCFPLGACRHSGARSPEALRDAYKQALSKNNPEAAYALLSPELQATVPRSEFVARWNAHAEERAAAVRATVPAAMQAPIRGGQTIHGNTILTWTFVGKRYQIVRGLPGLADTSTPIQTIRAFLASVRAADLGRIHSLLSDELAARLGDDWNHRATLIEAMLETPGAIEYSSDMQRAVLRYEPGRALTLEQTPDGWRIRSWQ